ncbi:MAG: phosphoribosylformylglycinamidine synthase subunit PurQ [Planctomycetaceae bacterium]|jgi:phosphoribosylformylglycinamidine synthase|nr:phosphoribosylformylglycinamidine synthase subunit PurQ [Planctomycetaceae bacterium]
MPQVLILRAPGTNCDQETGYAFQLAGAKSVEHYHINRILERPALLDNAGILCIPGGFSFGDDIAAGKIFAAKIRLHLLDALTKFRDAGKLILGICNGFQVLLKSGLIGSGSQMTLTWNTVPRYTSRWVKMKTEQSNCVFLQGLDELYLPIAHAEGRFVLADGKPVDSQFPLRYIDNPNGSADGIAGACDSTGRVFGLMPHPERYIDVLQHPHWTRFSGSASQTTPDGLQLFRNAVGAV